MGENTLFFFNISDMLGIPIFVSSRKHMTFPNKTHDFFGRLLPVEIALGIHGRSGISFIFWPSLSKFHFFSLPRAPGNENKLVARSTNLGPNMCATGPKPKVLPTSARRGMCRQGCPGRLVFTTHNKREATTYQNILFTEHLNGPYGPYEQLLWDILSPNKLPDYRVFDENSRFRRRPG